MKTVCNIVLLSFLLSTGVVLGQNDQKSEIKKVIEHFFKGLQSGDTTIVKETLGDNVMLQTTYINKDGKSILRSEDFSKFLKSLASKNPKDIWEEKLLSYHIQVDSNMANVWTPYEFYLNKNFSHCGVNSFQLFHDGSNWKIIYLIDTRRRKSCQKE